MSPATGGNGSGAPLQRMGRTQRQHVISKLLAAHRLGLTEVILPARNEADLDDVPDAVREQLTVHLAEDVADVVDLALEPVEAAAAVASA